MILKSWHIDLDVNVGTVIHDIIYIYIYIYIYMI